MGGRHLEERRLLLRRLLADEERRRLGQALRDDVGIVVHDVHRRLVHERRRRPRERTGDRAALASWAVSPRGAVRSAYCMARAAKQGAVRGAREQEHAGQQGRQADEKRSGIAEEPRDPAAEELAREPALARAERDHQPEAGDGEPGAEGVHVEEPTAEEHQPADDDEGERHRVGRRADGVAQPGVDLLAHDPAVPAEVQK